MEKSSSAEYKFIVPTPQIKTVEMIKTWQESETYLEYLGFITAVGDSIRGRKLSETLETSEACSRVMTVLAELMKNISLFPPASMKSRYGNPAFRDWFEKLESSAETLLADVVGPEKRGDGLVEELVPYFIDSFGNKTRIDYGTGHEMSFIMFLCFLFKVGVFQPSDMSVVGLKVFSEYMNLVRELQTVYRMEPAGSMGVWNLDDYQFVSFIWGAAQLSSDKERIKPKSISDADMAEMLKKDNLFFACLSYINKVKTGPFHEHSNQLWNISGVALWSKVYTGLIKMYRAEVLCKFPVVQHVRFGSVFSLAPAQSPPPDMILETDPGAGAVRQCPVPGVDSPRPASLPRPRVSADHLKLPGPV